MDNWLQHYAYKVDIVWWVFALPAACMVAIALITVCVQSVRTVYMNPVKSLRWE